MPGHELVSAAVGAVRRATQLHLHLIVTLASTLVGGSLAGILGATLAAPVVATTIRIRGLVAAAALRRRTPPDR